MSNRAVRVGLTFSLVAALCFHAVTSVAQSVWYQGFEGTEPSWEAAGGDARYEIREHRRAQKGAFTGNGCEYLALVAGNGSRVYISHAIGRARVIDELLPTVWVRSDRSGLRFSARIVLPRSKDPRTGRAVTTLVRGTSYEKTGAWQQLRIEDVPRQLAARTRLLRTEFGAGIDPREAYVDRVYLNVYGGPGVTRVWVDDLDIAGYVAPPPGATIAQTADPSRADRGAVSAQPVGMGTDPGGPPAEGPRRRVRIAGSVVLVDEEEFFARIVEHQGEPLSFLRDLGFNAVWLRERPSSALMEEAERLGLWLICPPPIPPDGDRVGEAPGAGAAIGPQFDRVLAWDLGRGLTRNELAATESWAGQARLADRWGQRPLVCGPREEWHRFSRKVDLLLIDRSPLGTSLSLPDYATWVAQRSLLARLGSPTWTVIQTQPNPELRDQWAQIAAGGQVSGGVSCDQLRLMALLAVSTGSRGLLFRSDSPLNAEDAATRRRAAALELINLELTLVEPWAAAGTLGTRAAGSLPNTSAAVLQAKRARLMLAMWITPQSQLVPGQSAGNGVSFVVPGVPVTSEAYELAPGGIRWLNSWRRSGGMHVTLDELGLSALVLWTAEPKAINDLSGRAQRMGRRAAQLQRELARDRLRRVQQTIAQLPAPPSTAAQAGRWLQSADSDLRQADAALAAGRWSAAYSAARRSQRPLRLVERQYWEEAVGQIGSPMSNPAAVGFQTLPLFWRSHRQLTAARPGQNRLVGGDFESMSAMLQGGWRHFQNPSRGIVAGAELSPIAARSGRAGLRLLATPPGEDDTPEVVETPPVWIASPAVPVDPGQWVRIHGWINVPGPIEGSVDGLMVADSIAGDALAERIAVTSGWQEFTLFRIVPASGQVSVSFALTGLGEAWLDDVTVQPMLP